MCGIVGTVQVGNGASLRAEVCSAMRMLVHRGPDHGALREFTVSFRPGPNQPDTESGSAKVLLRTPQTFDN
jgi:asparagine synthetase B (glutamine-hydrolysing)